MLSNRLNKNRNRLHLCEDRRKAGVVGGEESGGGIEENALAGLQMLRAR